MPIRPADSLRSELEQLKQETRRIARDTGRAVQLTTINGYSVRCTARRQNHRSGIVISATWWCDTRRVGFNQLMCILEGRHK